MEIRQGYSYHIKDEFFDLVQDKYLMGNKENGNYRPHLTVNLREVLAMYRRGIHLIFPDINDIQRKMEEELNARLML